MKGLLCEVCGTGCAVGALLLCRNYSNRHQVGCHSFCLPGPRHVAGMQHAPFTCLACLDGATQPGSVQAAAGSGLLLPAAAAQPAADTPADASVAPAGAAATNSQGVAPGRAAAADWSQLPADVLVHILRHVPLQHRLTTCALVHSSWAAAAEAATCSLSLAKDTEQALWQLWGVCGPKYGQQLTSLRLAGPHMLPLFVARRSNAPVLKQLLCPNLQDLDLTNIRVQLGPGESSHQGSAADASKHSLSLGAVLAATACQGLTRLSLSSVWVLGPHNSEVAALAALPRLQDLGLHYVSCVVIPDTAHEACPLYEETPPLHFLEGQGQLTCLKFSCWQHSALVAALQNNSSLTNLKHLELSTDHRRAKAGLGQSWGQQFSQLTCLRLTGVKSIPPGPTFPPSLQALHMVSCDVDAALLAAVTQLQHVQLSSCDVVGGPLGMAALLAWLQQQQELVSLCIQDSRKKVPGFFSQQQRSPGAYAGLTASSKLQRLVLECERVGDAAWQHIFLLGRPLLQLTYLDLTFTGTHVPGESQQQQMVQVCPRLRQLRLCWGSDNGTFRDRWQRGSWLQGSVLLPLTGLTSLSFNYATQTDIPGLAQLSWLQELHLAAPSRVPVTAMQPLTSLQQLTLLKVNRQMPTREESRDDDATNTTLICEADDKAVWLQLLECCQEAKRKHEEEAQRSAELSPDILPQHWYPKGYPIRLHKLRD